MTCSHRVPSVGLAFTRMRSCKRVAQENGLCALHQPAAIAEREATRAAKRAAAQPLKHALYIAGLRLRTRRAL